MGDEKRQTPICPYCKQPSVQTSGSEVYPRLRNISGKTFYKCAPCNALVGCHPGTDHPLGSLANTDLRKLRIQAHAAFDQLWNANFPRFSSRRKAYSWLGNRMGLKEGKCHIAMFDDDQCKKAIFSVEEFLK